MKGNRCEHFFLDTKNKPFCGHFPHDFKGNFPSLDIREGLDPQTYPAGREVFKDELVSSRKVQMPELKEDEPQPTKKARKPKATKKTEKIVVDQPPKMVETEIKAEQPKKNQSIVYEYDEW